MTKLEWVKDLVRAEEQMEESGIVDLSIGYDNERTLVKESLELLQDLKNQFVEASGAFNELKGSALGRIKIYGIAKTQGDFMLFRNGFKLIFTLSAPGKILVRFNFMGSGLGPATIPSSHAGTQSLMEEHVIQAKRGPFADLMWTFQDQQIRQDSLVRYYMTLFIRESAK